VTPGSLRLGTRGSALALAQAALAEAALAAAASAGGAPQLKVERVVITTTGDRRVASEGDPIAPKGDGPGIALEGDARGIFVREIEEALLSRAVDVAVHSLKDLPVDLPPGLVLAGVLERGDPRDAFCSRDGRTLDELPAGASVATGSPRRAAQLGRIWGHLVFVPIRGNVDTRLRKVREGAADGVVLARAGLVRLGLAGAITELIPLEVCLPAPGQGAIGLEARESDAGIAGLLARVTHPPTLAAVLAERAFLRRLGGGCRAPVAALGVGAEGGKLVLHGFVADPAGARFAASSAEGPAADAEALGVRLAERLLDEGAAEFMPG